MNTPTCNPRLVRHALKKATPNYHSPKTYCTSPRLPFAKAIFTILQLLSIKIPTATNILGIWFEKSTFYTNFGSFKMKSRGGRVHPSVPCQKKERYEGKVCLGSKMLGGARRVKHQRKRLVWTTGGFW